MARSTFLVSSLLGKSSNIKCKPTADLSSSLGEQPNFKLSNNLATMLNSPGFVVAKEDYVAAKVKNFR